MCGIGNRKWNRNWRRSTRFAYLPEGVISEARTCSIDETVWLTQPMMAELFACSVDNVSLHLRNIYEKGELDLAATSEDFSIVRTEGTRQITRPIRHHNLDAIISVGYRVKSKVATCRSSRVLHEMRGWTMNNNEPIADSHP